MINVSLRPKMFIRINLHRFYFEGLSRITIYDMIEQTSTNNLTNADSGGSSFFELFYL